ncbi:hypothetical protein C8Q70DRAFT_940890 [Cubamyces menziesii]|nr:hypothetical protein C8Q70DRAFT_940890 [Cubamyces menziesii]
MSNSKGWFNLEAAGGAIPETQFFEGDSAFKFLGLTRTQRLYGFIGCLIAGFALSLLGTILLIPLGLGTFALLYALGTIVSLIGTGFLIGFTKQLKLMFKPVRIVATIIFLASIALIFVGAFVIKIDVRAKRQLLLPICPHADRSALSQFLCISTHRFSSSP